MNFKAEQGRYFEIQSLDTVGYRLDLENSQRPCFPTSYEKVQGETKEIWGMNLQSALLLAVLNFI